MKELAERIADRLLQVYGDTQTAVGIAPVLKNGDYAGTYNRDELIREIESVLNQK